jgi:uncharacterized membrane protein YphA (DoxX/SURF4 family)
MDIALRLVLAAILVGGSVGKARDARGAADRLAPHGVPAGARPAAAWALIVVEAGLGVLVASGWATVPAAAATAALFLVFALAFLRLRMQGARRAPCGCLGGAAERPTLLVAGRAALLAALAGVVAAGAPGPTGDAALGAAVAVLAAAVAILSLLVLALYRQVGVLSLRLGPRAALEIEEEGPPVGAPAPALRGLGRRGPELVAFASPACRLCSELAPGLRALARDGLALREVDEDAEHESFARWRVPGTPYVVYLEDGLVAAKGLVNTLEQVDGVVAAGMRRRRAAA